nr:type I-E CRISPR-associated protein Cse2/CasB [Actinomyces sp.]
MTTPISAAQPTESASAPSDSAARRYRPLRREGSLVERRLVGPRGLQHRYSAGESSGRADLAALRRAARMSPGALPEVWNLTEVPVPPGHSDAPTREEIAVHTAMTLYAIHQQSRTEPMHVPGRGLGQAARALIGPPDDELSSARARFNALVTSTTMSELTHHLQAFVSQLRARRIPLDYAALADELVRFQQADGAKAVRLTWARQYADLSRTPVPDTTDSTDSLSTLEH